MTIEIRSKGYAYLLKDVFNLIISAVEVQNIADFNINYSGDVYETSSILIGCSNGICMNILWENLNTFVESYEGVKLVKYE